MEKSFEVGLGAAPGYGGDSWRSAPIERVAEFSPQIALARAWRIPLAPYLLNIRGTFTDTTQVIGPFTWAVNGEATRLNQFAIVDRMVFEIDVPNANAGQTLKPLSDFFFGMQSGVTATLTVDGAPRYVVAPDFTPIRTLMAMVAEAWPMGWVITNTQALKMQFQQNVALAPTYPMNITCTFRTWTPYNTTRFVGMTDSQALKELEGLGCDVSAAKNSPGCR